MEALSTASQPFQEWPDEYESLFTEEQKSEDGLAVSEEEYWKTYYNHPDFSYEWNNGYLEEKPVSDIKGSRIYRWFCTILECFFSTHPVGEIVNLDIGFRLALPDKTSIRKPDIAVVLDGNAVEIDPDYATYPGVYDICIESLSYSSLKAVRRDTFQKKREYEGIGVKEYYILDARGKETAFFHRNRAGKYVHIKPVGDIIRSTLLPEFQFRISDLYQRPSFEEMAGDDVYKEYVLPFYREAEERAEREKQRADKAIRWAEQEHLRAYEANLRAEQEHLKADEERRRADRLAAKLKELGVSLENM